MFLPELEKQPDNLFFIRPRCFGKSIFLSMLYSYYDCNQKDKRVEALRQGTQLHKIIMQFKGWELARMEEV